MDYEMPKVKENNCICKTCGKEFYRHKSYIKIGSKQYCSRECAHIGRKNGRNRKCKFCGKEFYVSKSQINHGEGKYCSRDCKHKGMGDKVDITCLYCGKTFNTIKSQIDYGGGKYCSRECSGLAHSGIVIAVKTKSKYVTNKCKICGADTNNMVYCSRECQRIGRTKKIQVICPNCEKEFHASLSRIKAGRGKYCSKNCANKHKRTKELSESFRIRHSEVYRKWRKSVFERDNYTCQHCFIVGGKLEAHHILPFAIYIEERFSVDNGLTLCIRCHNSEHNRLRKDDKNENHK